MMGYALTHDLEHRRRPIAFLLQSNEKEEAYATLFADCARYWRSNGWEPYFYFSHQMELLLSEMVWDKSMIWESLHTKMIYYMLKRM